MALIYKGDDISHGLVVHDWNEHGMQFPTRRMRKVPTLYVQHWTGGEADEEGLFGTLKDRRLSVHLYIRQDGEIFQFADLANRCAHAGMVNFRSIGVEIANRGVPPKSKSLPRGARPRPATWGKWKREVYEDTIRRRKIKLTEFYPAQIESALRLAETITAVISSIPKAVPKNDDGTLLQGTPNWVRRDFNGVAGHFQLSTNKIDPGTDLLNKMIAEGF